MDGKSSSYATLYSFNNQRVEPFFTEYTNQMKMSVENFWTANLLVNVKNWQAIYDGALEKLKKYDNVRATPREEMLSVDSKAKLFEAEEQRKKAEEMWGKSKENTKMAGRRSIDRKPSAQKEEL